MLVEFSVANFRSFGEKQTFSFVASSSAELRETHTFSPEMSGTPDLVLSAAVYGPNAAGKSNLVRALFFMKDLVVHSSKQKQMGEELEVEAFRFDPQFIGQPSEFEAILVQHGVRYQYGFSASKARVHDEWLYVFPEGRRQRWFERSFNEMTGKYEWYLGSKLKGAKEVWKEATRNNALFLSTGIQLNSDSLKPLFDWFKFKLKVMPPEARFVPIATIRSCQDHLGKREILEFLNAADLSIFDLKIKKERLSKEDFPDDFPDELAQQFLEMEKAKVVLRHGRQKEPERSAWIGLEEESSGTQKLFELAGPLIHIFQEGSVFVVDELDTSLHPHIIRFLLNLFHNSKKNPNHAQLLFTTHNTSLMDQALLRRDQLWFLERNRNFASEIYPLTDFRPRKGEALESGYLKGRYGALPLVGEPTF